MAFVSGRQDSGQMARVSGRQESGQMAVVSSRQESPAARADVTVVAPAPLRPVGD